MKAIHFIFAAFFFFSITPAKLDAQTSCKGKSTALQTLGMQGGSILYTTYELIGSIHDGMTNDTWDQKTATNILDEQVDMMKKMQNQYQELIDSEFLSDPDDSAFVVKMKKTTQLVQKEAEDLKMTITDKSDTNEAAYQDARKAAWKEIAALLGIEE